jgi:hypothetical protein
MAGDDFCIYGCELGYCPVCSLCCRHCQCELEEPDGDLSDMEEERYYWDMLIRRAYDTD